MRPDSNEAIQLIKNMDSPTITPAIAAAAINCDPQLIRHRAKHNPQLLGFPVTLVGNRTKIPRVPFLNFLTGGGDKQ